MSGLGALAAEALGPAAALYETGKTALVGLTGLSKDAWHVYAGLLVQLAAAPLFRRRLASLGPLVLLAALEAVNEWADARHYHALGGDPWRGWASDTLGDVFNSLALPVLLWLIARFWPARLLPPPPDTGL